MRSPPHSLRHAPFRSLERRHAPRRSLERRHENRYPKPLLSKHRPPRFRRYRPRTNPPPPSFRCLHLRLLPQRPRCRLSEIWRHPLNLPRKPFHPTRHHCRTRPLHRKKSPYRDRKTPSLDPPRRHFHQHRSWRRRRRSRPDPCCP